MVSIFSSMRSFLKNQFPGFLTVCLGFFLFSYPSPLFAQTDDEDPPLLPTEEEEPALVDEPLDLSSQDDEDSDSSETAPEGLADDAWLLSPYRFAFSFEGELIHIPTDLAREGGMSNFTVNYTVKSEGVFPALDGKQTIEIPATIEWSVSGLLWSSDTAICELNIALQETKVEVTARSRPAESPEDTAHHVQIKMIWPQVEETWQSRCPISIEQTFVSEGDPEFYLYSMLRKTEPPLSSAVLTSESTSFSQDFTSEYFLDDSETFTISASGFGTLTLQP